MALEETRDLRSVARDTKRAKDHNHKWARGNRPSSGVYYSWVRDAWSGSEKQQEKIRPERLSTGKHIRSPNVNKPNVRRTGYMIPQSYSRPKAGVVVELQDPSNMSRSLHELLPSPYNRRKMSVADDFLYSFDKSESPGKPLSLELFVKTDTKQTEKFVEKEYEILDYNGDAVKGRKALKDVHRGKMMAPPAEEDGLLEVDGFELV